jgi:hypothetical protein
MVTDLVVDWKIVPFIEIEVSEDKCDYDKVPVFESIWGGTEPGCRVYNNLHYNSQEYIMSEKDFAYKFSTSSKSSAVRRQMYGEPYNYSPFSSSSTHYYGPICNRIVAEQEV